MNSTPGPPAEPIAVIGLDCRVPGASDPEAFWALLVNGIDAVTEVPAGRWDVDEYYDECAGVPGKMNTRCGGFLDDIEMFDHEFFGLSRRSAAFMDPQQRLLLEVAWTAFEHAGIPSHELAGSNCASFIGMSQSDYGRLVSADPDDINAYSLTGNAPSVTVNRLSYFFDLRGPSMMVDSACSSSLVAVHLACQSLRTGECDLAIAGGCNLILSPHATVAASQLWLTSPGGRCRSFSATADGFVRSEGCGIVVLKRLADAERDGDRCLAILRGSAVNQNGRGSGITAPSSEAQAQVIRRALQVAGANAGDIDYVEAHGAGSRANDALELAALQRVFGGRSPDRPFLLGSVKSNIGSLEPAAGIVGLIKVILAVQHGVIPPTLHLGAPNQQIEGDAGFRIPTRATAWPAGSPRRASIHSYGIGGTNAHVVLQEAPPTLPPDPEEPNRRYPVLLSARTPGALRAMARRLGEHIDRRPEQSLRAIASTLAYRRVHFPHRLAVIVASHDELRTALDAWLDGKSASDLVAGAMPAGDRIQSAGNSLDPMVVAARRWVAGEQVQWPGFSPEDNTERVALPSYPFQRVRCWYRD